MNVAKTSVESIITRISDLGISGSGWHSLAVEYAGEAIRGIGYHIGMKEFKDMEIEVSNYKAFLPNCIETLDDVTLNNCPLVLVYDEDGLCCRDRMASPANYNDIVEYNEIIDNINYLREKIEEQVDTSCPDIDYLNSMKNELNKAYALIGTFGSLQRNFSLYRGEWYKISNNTLEVSFESGYIKIAGSMFDVDEKGYPYIVDTHKYTEAVFWYVLYKLLLGEYDHPKITWQIAYQMWDGEDGYRQKASNEGLRFDKPKIERFARRWLSIARDSREIYRI